MFLRCNIGWAQCKCIWKFQSQLMKASELSVYHTACSATVCLLQSYFQGLRHLFCQTFTICGLKKRIVFLLLNPPIHSLCNTWVRGGTSRAPGNCNTQPQFPLPCADWCADSSVEVGAGRQHYWGPSWDVSFLSVQCPMWNCEETGEKHSLGVARRSAWATESTMDFSWLGGHTCSYLFFKKGLQITNYSLEREIILFRIRISPGFLYGWKVNK